MANRFDDEEIDRRLDRDLEREGGYRGESRIPLNPNGTLRKHVERTKKRVDLRARLIIAGLVLALGACATDPAPHTTTTVVSPTADAATPSHPDGAPFVAPCDQLAGDPSDTCVLACTDWQAFTAGLTPGHCVTASCALADGTTWTPGACIDANGGGL